MDLELDKQHGVYMLFTCCLHGVYMLFTWCLHGVSCIFSDSFERQFTIAKMTII